MSNPVPLLPIHLSIPAGPGNFGYLRGLSDDSEPKISVKRNTGLISNFHTSTGNFQPVFQT